MKNLNCDKYNILAGYPTGHRNGFVLIITIVTLVVLTAMVYTLGSKLSARQSRDQYLVDYQNARYACDSATKYSLAIIENLQAECVSRPNEPDFSDLYQMSQEEYDLMVQEWLEIKDEFEDANDVNDINDVNDANAVEAKQKNMPAELSFADLFSIAQQTELPDYNSFDPNDPNRIADNNFSDMYSLATPFDINDANEAESFFVRGPYGPPWPLVQEPIEFTLGNSTVKIVIEDENAKLPLVWALTTDAEHKRQADAAVASFFEWMKLDLSEIEQLSDELKDISEIKEFSTDLKPITIKKSETKEVKRRTSRKSRRSRKSRSRRSRRTRRKTVTKASQRELVLHRTDFSKILNSSAIDHKLLLTPAIESSDRIETPDKYIGFWGSQKVNINTAPRHVLEAAFTFGGDEAEIAEEIIQMRRIKPFADVDELAKELYSYNDSIEKCKPYITTKSSVFTVKITAYSGTATASAVAAVLKDSGKVIRIAIISE